MSVPLNCQFLEGREQTLANSALPVGLVQGLAHKKGLINLGRMDSSVGGCLHIQRDE